MIPLVPVFASSFAVRPFSSSRRLTQRENDIYPRDQGPVWFCSVAAMRKVNIATSIAGVCIASLLMSACGHVEQERKIEFIDLAFGTSDARERADCASSSSLTAHQIARLRDVSADAGLTSEQIDRLMDALAHEPDQGMPEPAPGGDR